MRFRAWGLGVIAGLAVLGGVGCASRGGEKGGGAALKAEAAPAGVLVSGDWVQARLGEGKLVVLHVAPTADSVYPKEHLPGARRVGFTEIVVESREGVPNELPTAEGLVALVQRLGIEEDSQVVLYDEGNGLQAARAFFTLEVAGVPRVAVLDGQLGRWRAEGRPLTAEVPTFEASSFVPRPQRERVVAMAEVQALNAGKGTTPLLDARDAEEFSGAKAGKEVARGGHIPCASSIPWRSTLTAENNPVLRSAGELEMLFANHGIKRGDPVVTYCRTGVSGSHLYLVARHLGYEARLYDGSMTEWSANAENPVAGPVK